MGKAGLKKTALGRPITLGNCIWAAWSCVAASSTHTKETSGAGRALAVTLTLGGLLSYSLLTGAVSAQMRVRIESLRSGAEARSIPESGHIVICGTNAHLVPLLRQLDRSRAFARLEGKASGRQTVIVVVDKGGRPAVDAMIRNQVLPELNVLTRSGELDDVGLFVRVGVARAEHVIMLASENDDYEADAQALLSMLAVQSAIEAEPRDAGERRAPPRLVIEVSRQSTAKLLESLGGPNVATVENMTNRVARGRFP